MKKWWNKLKQEMYEGLMILEGITGETADV